MPGPCTAAEQVVREAWIEDAVLSLFAPSKILGETGVPDGEALAQVTCNQFLGCFGEPTKVEAAIGRVYEQEGLEQASRWIEEKLLPLFERQEENRMRKSGKRTLRATKSSLVEVSSLG